MTRSPKVTVKSFKEAAKGSGGVQGVIAQKLGISRQAVSQWLERNPEYRLVLEQERELVIDLGEAELFKKLKAGDWKAISFTLSRLGKKRDYTEKTETETNITGTLETKVWENVDTSKFPEDKNEG